MKQKGLRKLVSMILAVVMVLSMSAVAFADETPTYTITINNEINGYTYIAYQIFAGDVSEDGTTLSNVEFGSALSEEDQSTLLSYYSSTLSADKDEDGVADYESSVAGLAEALADGNISAADFAEYIATFTLTSAGTSEYSESDSRYTISVVGAGYYLIKNTVVPNTTEDTGAAYSNYMLEVVGNVTIENLKKDIPTLEKDIDDINDSTETDATTSVGDSVDSADHDKGDHVPFTLTATLPTNYSEYTVYKLVFHDSLSSGLTYDSNSVSVYVDDTEVDINLSNISVSTSCSDGCSLEVTIADTNVLYESDETLIDVSSTSKIIVKYTATLDDDASYKENNDAYLEYSNNPTESTGTTTGKTTNDKTTVYNYTMKVDKVDDDGNALTGAGFTLYKYVKDGVATYNEETEETTYSDGWVAVGSEITDETRFEWSGLDDGQYKLVETTTPDGYNTMEELVFVISADHTENEITSLTITDTSSNTLSDFTTYTEETNVLDENENVIETIDAGTITITIANHAGSTLPSTGGIGTTIFYIIGGVLVAGAAVLLITKKRLGKME
ncbi:MAG: isopeptide-forming domain-containing fimbrial protein [Clostridiales bacterium]|nr:isopeptide-forming domain-containing fimbrial protein [Clostridiales bacterium]